ncbi:hypothetical protein [Psychroserpens sp.]|uniref:hypothetical protein n=1 Tax=Psychroserpens sp. TaxID=2020870 RepID=UPI001B233D16|nr:hypothetical protein [Psychroserpens sp.]MBO6606546.1 hypothetical protein [Psychroserpens sp.]MBO6631684.1 hypothetical protein [Psychroserpens sp.]MBO6653250.1 hypothetical protein [Psychroserpens sp.]MBO6680723.1 hypothetical protein [Psychroserpens sp.]MBO6750319.1 hypothetical protein [Psychroserpens sp.]
MLAKQQRHIIQLLIFSLTLVLLLPSVVKFSHVLSHHEHEICEDTNASHFHEIDVDCEFYKFKLTTNFYSALKQIEITPNEFFNNSEYSYHAFVKQQKRSSKAQRGPPGLV